MLKFSPIMSSKAIILRKDLKAESLLGQDAVSNSVSECVGKV